MARREPDRSATERAAQGLRADRLTRILDEVQRLCAELDAMSRRQGAELDAGRAGDAAIVVEERSRLVAKLGEAARQLGPDPESFQRTLNAAPADLAARAREQAAAIAAVVAEVLARDAEDRLLLENERDRLAEEMAGLGRSRTALTAYGSTARPEAVLQDRKG